MRDAASLKSVIDDVGGMVTENETGDRAAERCLFSVCLHEWRAVSLFN
jgi:hypothetical protein